MSTEANKIRLTTANLRRTALKFNFKKPGIVLAKQENQTNNILMHRFRNDFSRCAKIPELFDWKNKSVNQYGGDCEMPIVSILARRPEPEYVRN